MTFYSCNSRQHFLCRYLPLQSSWYFPPSLELPTGGMTFQQCEHSFLLVASSLAALMMSGLVSRNWRLSHVLHEQVSSWPPTHVSRLHRLFTTRRSSAGRLQSSSHSSAPQLQYHPTSHLVSHPRYSFGTFSRAVPLCLPKSRIILAPFQVVSGAQNLFLYHDLYYVAVLNALSSSGAASSTGVKK